MKYPIIDKNMSDCQMGARKKMGCKNNIFIINGIIHEARKSMKMKPILLQIYDYSQMFDSIDLEQALCDMYDAGVDDDTLALLHNANKEINMAVKTPSGLTVRQIIKNIVLQGDTWGSILASVQVDRIGKELVADGHGYWYKDKLPVAFLGLVDDIIGVTEVGLPAQKMNACINIKTAEKTLQFGAAKCKSMLVGKNIENVLNSDLMVDDWDIKYEDNIETGESDLIETYLGQIPIKKTEEQKYLGFVLSCKGDNMANIRQIKKKSIGVIRNLLSRLNSLNLRRYYFECAVILMNVMLRGSILYAADMYYNLKENELRQLERIEEGYLRQVLNTARGCPISQIYLEIGQYPARFEIQKMRLLYLKYILQQNEDSLLYKFFHLQLEEPTRGDWGSRCLEDLQELKITESLEDIKQMSKRKFANILKSRIKENALKYLKEKVRSKGKDIKYSDIQMAEYLSPTNTVLTISEKQKMFATRNRMNDIPANFSEIKPTCHCGKTEDNLHIYK